MRPILVELESLHLNSYLCFFFLALITGVVLSVLEARRYRFSPEIILILSFPTLLTALIGARLFYMISNLDFNLETFFFRGGAAYYGGLLTGTLCLYLLAKKNQLSWEKLFNAVSPGLCIAHALGRLGCFLKGCCYGKNCALPWAVYYHDPRGVAPLATPIHPSQLYEFFGLIALALWLYKNNRRHSKGGLESWKGLLYGYSVLRFMVEFSRGDAFRGQWGLFSPSQWVSLAVFLLLLLLDFRSARAHNGSP